jgi:hypothetical protein
MGKLVGPGLVMNQATNDSVERQYKTRGSGMIPVYRDRNKEHESWACVKCQKQDKNADHKHGPHNGICTCDKMMGPSDLYRQNYDFIRWD